MPTDDNPFDITPEEAIEIKKVVAAAAASSDAQKALDKDMDNVTVNTANALENFKYVHGKLLALDNEHLVQKKYAPEWKVLYDEFYDILDKSKTLASKISGVGGRFTGTMMNIIKRPSVSVDVKMKYVKNTAAQTEGFEAEAKVIEKDLDTLDAKIVDLQAQLDPKNFAEQERKDLEKRLGDINIAIDKIHTEIKGIDDKISKVSDQLGISPLAAGIIGGIIPLAGIFISIAAANKKAAAKKELDGLQGQKKAKEAELKSKTDERDTVQDTLNRIAKAREELKGVGERMTSIRGALTFFKGIWATIRGEITKIVQAMNSQDFQDSGNFEDPEVLTIISDDVLKYYTFLANACDRYATQLGKYSKPAS